MHNLHQLMQSEFTDKVIIQCTATDLKDFASSLINETKKAVQEQYERKYYSMEDVCNMLHIKQATIYSYIRKGLLIPTKVGGKNLFDKIELNELAKRGLIGKYKHTPKIT